MRLPAGAAILAAAVAVPAAGAQRSTNLDTVRVSVSSRTESTPATTARSVEIIGRAELEARRGQSLQAILGQQLGMDVDPRSPAQADIAMRGSSTEQVVILVDGQRVSDQQTGHFDLDLAVPTDMIDHIEILRGAGSALYGPNAVGGVVNIVTRRDVAGPSLRTRAGSFGTVDASFTGGRNVGRAGIGIGGDISRSDGSRAGTDYRITQTRLSGSAPLGRGRMAADAAIGVRNFGARAFYSPYPSYEDTRTSTASLRWTTPLADRWTLDASAAGRRHVDLFTLVRDDPARYQNRHDNWQTGGAAVARYAAPAGAVIALGAEAFGARLVSARLGDRGETRSAAFSELSLGSAGGPSLNVGLRGDQSSAYGGFLSPSLAAAVPLGSGLRMRGSIGRGFRAPTWTERFYVDPANIGSADLHPETFWSGEIGVAARVSERVSVDVAAFERQADGLIDWARPSGSLPSVPWRTMNVRSARYRGIEAAANATAFGWFDWTLRASGLTFDPHGADGYEGKYALRPITRTAGAAIATRELHGLVARLDLLDTQRAHEDRYTRANMRLDYRRGPWRTTLDVENITGAQYLDASGQPVAGRGVYVGLEWVAR